MALARPEQRPSTRLRPRWLLVVAVVVLVALSPLLSTGTARAHPLGNFTTNRYARIELYSHAVRVHYVLDIAEIPAFQLRDTIDANHDDTLEPAELAAWASSAVPSYRDRMRLDLDDKPVPLAPIATSAEALPGQGGLDTLRATFVFEARPRAATGKQVTIAFHDDNLAGKPGWKELVVRPGSATVQVDPALTVDQSDELRSYPAESLKSAPDVASVAFTWVAGTGDPAPAVAAIGPGGVARATGGFAGTFDHLLRHDRSLWFVLLSLFIAVAFGAQHALGPGHGKTMVAAYLVGSKGTPRQAVALGLTVTATHTSTVYLLGAITLVAAHYITPATVYLWMALGSGLMVLAFGAVLVLTRLRAALAGRRRDADGAHRHGLFGKPHFHTHEHNDGGHAAPMVVPPPLPAGRERGPGGEGTRAVLSLGVLGGLLPCPSAVVVMVAAISQGQVLLGMLLIVAFSLGLAGVLTAIGLSLVLGSKLPLARAAVFRRPIVTRAVTVMPVLSAVVVMLVGAALTYQAWNQPGL